MKIIKKKNNLPISNYNTLFIIEIDNKLLFFIASKNDK